MKTSLKINFVFLQIQSNFHSGTWHVNKESHILKRTNRGQSMSHITGRQGVVAESWTIHLKKDKQGSKYVSHHWTSRSGG